MAGISTKPYLIRAIHEWCTDSGYRPYIAVAVDERTIVPREFVRKGEIVLNVSASATNRLQIGNEVLEFEARFGGVARHVSIPIENISAIFAQENGHGMAFEAPKAEESAADDSGDGAPSSEDGEGDATAGAQGVRRSAPRRARKPALRDAKAGEEPADASEPPQAHSEQNAATTPDESAEQKPRARRKPKLASVPAADQDASAGEGPPAPRRGASISAVPSRSPRPAHDEPGRHGKSGDAPDGDEPDPPPAAPVRPRLTRVK